MFYYLLIKARWYFFVIIVFFIYNNKVLYAKNVIHLANKANISHTKHLAQNNKEFNNNNFDNSDLSEFDDKEDSEDNNVYNVKDPFEKLNRKSFAFTMWLDNGFIKYVDGAYTYIFPRPIRTGLLNMANNINEPTNAINHLLQFKFISFAKVTLRFAINTTLGFLGAVDVASTLNLYPNHNDLGYTLSYYHIGNGFYIFVPVLGPYTFQSALAEITSNVIYSEAINNIITSSYLWVFVAQGSSRSVSYLENRKTFNVLLNNSADGYSLVKSVYLQNRAFNAKKLKNSW